MAQNNNAPQGKQLEPSGGKRSFLILSVLLLTTTAISASYGGSIALPQKLLQINAMDYYSVVSASSSMGMMMALPLVGVLGSKFGVKAIAFFGVLGQLFFRILLMFTSNIALFIVFWALTGVCSGLFMSAPYAMMADIVSAEERPKYYGLIATFSAAGALAGPVLTGAVVDLFSVNMGLIAYVVFAIIPMIGLSMFYPNKKRPSTGKFDFAGIFLLVVAVLGIVMWLSLGGKLFEFASPVGLLLLGVGIVGAVALIMVERKKENPSVPIHMFKKSRFRATFLVQMLLVAYSTCVAAYGIVYVQQVMQQSASVSSTVTMPQTIVQAIVGLFIGSYVGKSFKKRFRPIALLALVLYTTALVIFSTLTPNTSMIVIYVATALGGVSQAITQSTYAPFFQSQLKPEEIGSAQGMYQFGSTGGSCIFTAVCGAAINMGFSLNQIFMLGTGVLVVALIIGVIGFRFPKAEIEAEVAATLNA